MQSLQSALQTSPLFYISRDIERSLGISLDTEGYVIISNYTPFGKRLAEKYDSICLIEEDRLLDTWELLEHPKTKQRINDQRTTTNEQQPNIVVFKNTERIENICKDNNWHLLSPSAQLANRVEEKISQVEWLGNLSKFLPPHEIVECKNIKWKNNHFILQFNRAHTGTGTLLITSSDQLDSIKNIFPDRPARVTEYIAGPVFTSNNIVAKEKIFVGNISYQITGLSPFTDNQFATIGNDWRLAATLLSTEQKNQYHELAEAIGEKLRLDGWKGLFGIDVIMNEQTGKLCLLEINARQTASAAYESQLQHDQRSRHSGGQATINDQRLITTFEAHLMALLNIDVDGCSLLVVDDGAQVVVRISNQRTTINEQNIAVLSKQFIVIPYTNTKPATELLRIQSEHGVMEAHNTFNSIGEKIVSKVTTGSAALIS